MMEFVGRFVQRFWKEIILVSILITAFFGYYASTITINTDLTTLLPEDDEYAQQYKELFSGDVIGDSVVIVFDYDGNREKALEFVGLLKERLDKKVDIVKFFQNVDSMAMMGTTGLLLSNSNIFEQLTSTLNYTQFLLDNPAAIDFSIVRNAGASLKKIEDVFNKVLDIENPQNYVIFSPDNEIFLTNIILTKPALDLDFAASALEEIEGEIDTLLSETVYDYQYGMTGSYQQALDTNDVISRDLSITSIITLTSISLLFFIVYGNLYTTLSIFISLITGTLWSVGIFQFIFQSLDFMSSFVIALLLGLGIDFGIHLSHRISEELSEHAQEFNKSGKKRKRELTKEAVMNAVKHTGRNTVIGGLTTIAAFISLVFVDSPALQRVSIMAGIGILTFLIVMIVVLPSLLIFFYRYLKIKEKKIQSAKTVFKKMVKGSRKRPKIIVVSLLIALIPLSFFTYRCFKNFNYTPAETIPTDIESAKVFQKITDHGIFSNADNSIITYISDPKKLYDAEELIRKKTPDLGNLNSLASFIPKEMFENYDSFKRNIEKIINTSQNAFTLLLFKKLGIYGDLDYLYGLFQKSPNFSSFINAIFQSNILPNEAKKYLSTYIDGEMVYKIYAEPTYDIWVDNNLKGFVEGLKKTEHDFYGYPIIYYKVMTSVIKSIIFAVLLASIIIAMTVLLSLKKFSDSITVLLVLGMTIIFLFGFYNLLGMQINFMTILALPLIMGMAIDAPIHLIGRLREEEEKNTKSDYLKNVFLKTGKAITLSSVTTIIAFSSLLFASSPILGEFGVIMTMGIAFNWIITFFWMKSFRDMIKKREWNGDKHETDAM